MDLGLVFFFLLMESFPFRDSLPFTRGVISFLGIWYHMRETHLIPQFPRPYKVIPHPLFIRHTWYRICTSFLMNIALFSFVYINCVPLPPLPPLPLCTFFWLPPSPYLFLSIISISFIHAFTYSCFHRCASSYLHFMYYLSSFPRCAGVGPVRSILL